ncbi:hypothetical protein P3T97_11795 [Mammaliicoccus sciuri]|uniref:hypothetical protein n=1 Tax=Mammaliicoccus sciuri TaxID=1296 RepID=UPI002B25A457|nr:hypothetical protein [Mammaliicoccus sciuri]WQJ65443.1 hypothetical protein P3T97_11795 [Mammaliicoccus sciuri]
MNSLIYQILITVTFAILTQWLLIGFQRTSKLEKNKDRDYIILAVAYVVLIWKFHSDIKESFYEISLVFTISSLVLNWLYSNYIYREVNHIPAENLGRSVVEIIKLLFQSILLISPKNVKITDSHVKEEVKASINKQRLVLYFFAFIISIFAHYKILENLDLSLTTFIIFDVFFYMFLEQYYFES